MPAHPAVLLALAWALAALPAAAGCNEDSGHPASREECEARPEPPAQRDPDDYCPQGCDCESDGDCQGGQYCYDGCACLAPCQTSFECCKFTEECRDQRCQEIGECTTDQDCSDDTRCGGRVCIRGEEGLPCSSHDDCTAYCVNGKCSDSLECEDDSGCFDVRMHCAAGRCEPLGFCGQLDDRSCPPGSVCVDDECLRGEPGAPCCSETECASRYCESYQCEVGPRCQAHRDCGTDLSIICRDGRCQRTEDNCSGNENVECSGAGTLCFEGQCMRGAPGAQCQDTGECFDRYCEEGRCQRGPRCTTDADCQGFGEERCDSTEGRCSLFTD